MENERVKKSKDFLEEKRKMVKQKFSIKKTVIDFILVKSCTSEWEQ